MSLNNYYFNIPINQWDSYIKHIIEGIYGITDGKYNLVRDYNGVRRIELKTNAQIPLIKSLPKTVKISKDGAVYYSKDNLTMIENVLDSAINDFLSPGSKFHINPRAIEVQTSELESIIRQLALDGKITRFASLEYNRYIVCREPDPVAILFNVIDGVLMVNIYAESICHTFDVDDGYSGLLSCMNPIWLKWKDLGDITAPIQPPNHI